MAAARGTQRPDPVLTLLVTRFVPSGGRHYRERIFFPPRSWSPDFQSISARDLIVVEILVMLLVFCEIIVVNYAVDLAYTVVDPRLRST
jgi:peptide/nickel transport system permease protein